ncbi:hypothetical protein OOJ91_14815 [Micromonospora lupini]|uniref:hypothetical protein n=1 Tax=Micromonospora lupini TaxID=285679 RepID=UPI002252C12E|nr:hypothetical protein [Micromonospora lupini]MCX5067116.1 hypothetical protein [Micromonospora lupini]
MSRLRRSLGFLIVLTTGLATVPAAATAAAALPTYTFIDLGTLGVPSTGEPPSSDGSALNNARTVVGHSTIDGIYNFHAFAWSDGAMSDLGALYVNTYSASSAEAINEQGVVVGATHVNATDPPTRLPVLRRRHDRPRHRLRRGQRKRGVRHQRGRRGGRQPVREAGGADPGGRLA